MQSWINWTTVMIVVIPPVIMLFGYLFKYISHYIVDQLKADKKRKETQKSTKKPQDENLINVKWKYIKEKKKKENKVC